MPVSSTGRPRSRLCAAPRAATDALALGQPFHVLAQVDPAAVVEPRARGRQTAADVGIQRGGADAERGAGLAGGDELMVM
jgi:hypothetical protein